MLVYGHRTFRLNLRTSLDGFIRRLAALPPAPDHDTIVSLLIDVTEAACAYADALCAECDDERGELEAWTRASSTLASALVASWDGQPNAVPGFLSASASSLRDAVRSTPPLDVEARTGEGFAVYGLFPEQYIEAARRVADELTPKTALCLGLRSIGFTLAHLVGAAFAARGIRATVRTARPRGVPFDRRLALGPALARRIATDGKELVAIVDDGPGISGSSFAAAAEAVASAGVARERVVLFTGWNAPAQALRSDRAKRAWNAHRRVSISFEDTWRCRPPLDQPVSDISAGSWRDLVFAGPSPAAHADWPAVHPQHERRKYVRGNGECRIVWKFAGLGRYAEAAFARAERVAAAGFSVPPHRLVHGFVERRWIEGIPLTRTSWNPIFAAHVSEYLAFLARTCSTGQLDDLDELRRMMDVNVSESLGAEWMPRIDALAESARRYASVRVEIDGRMLPHEWIASGDTVLKVDETDHHADDFFPGDRDIAWDVAGAIEEFGLSDAEARAFVSGFEQRSRDTSIGERLPFYRAAYVAYRLGYASLSAESLAGTPDAARFTALAQRYRRSLAERLRPTR